MSIFRLRLLRIFYQELSTLVSSNISVVEAMDILSKHIGNPSLKKASSQIRQILAQGDSLGIALSDFPRLFPQWHINLIKYSEVSGTLNKGLQKIVDYLEKDYDRQRKLIVGLAYPVIIFHLGVFLLSIPTLISGGVISYLYQVSKILLPAYFLILFIYLLRSLLLAKMKAFHDRVVLSIPFFGKFIKAVHLNEFVRALGCLSGSGLAIVQSWKIAAASCDNMTMQKHLLKGSAVIEAGGQLDEAFSRSGVLSGKMLGMITVGQRSGSINAMLEKIAIYIEKENDIMINLLLTVIPVVVYISVAAYIAYKVISFYLGYFSKVFSY